MDRSVKSLIFVKCVLTDVFIKLFFTSKNILGKILDGPPLKKAKIDTDLKISTSGGNSPTKSSSKSPTLNIDMTTNNPLKWTVTQVCDFVKSLPGCSDYVEDFQLQVKVGLIVNFNCT